MKKIFFKKIEEYKILKLSSLKILEKSKSLKTINGNKTNNKTINQSHHKPCNLLFLLFYKIFTIKNNIKTIF